MIKSTTTFVFSIFLVLLLLTGAGHTESYDKLYNKVSDSIYQIYAVDKNKQTIVAHGSSVAINTRFLATNCHVALAGNFLIVRVDQTPYLARLCYYNQDKDLCIADVVGVDLKPAKIRASKSVALDERIFAVSKTKAGDPVVTQGFITKLLSEDGKVVLQINAKIKPGSSGGGLFDKDGYLIGITAGGIPGTDVGFAIATELILEVIDPINLPSCKTPQ